MDTVAPSAVGQWIISVSTPGILHASDYVTDISDATKTTVGFVGEPQKRADLSVMNTGRKSKADAASRKQRFCFLKIQVNPKPLIFLLISPLRMKESM
ncbi:MAG: hypothetical protein V8S36_03900 [Lachnospiraceae bacterium]